ncbi:radical SAM protein [Novosphingobium sp. KCTC 2891]|uniref:radical SAM protein n=1 Tax=Novosphingobium sp. KCTC 2891 TaxID=2989730 RepID=UPI0022222C1C|nr:radical SAM protein [Novosphingobium sp. KCTC 2891]MCW1384454.1 radical SAM protein [Novosphingobium sp. KCTC 2891]
MKKTIRAAIQSCQDGFWKILPGSDPAIFSERPYELHLEFTNLCNADCVFCPYSQQNRPHAFMTDEIFAKSLSDFVAVGGGPVDITPVVGDALIHPKALEWVRRLRATPQVDRIAMTTNGILLAREGIDAVLDAGFSRINISTAGFEEAMYRRIYRNAMYRKVRDNIYALYEANALRADPVQLVLAIRADKPLEQVLADPDFAPLRTHNPAISFNYTYANSGGLIKDLPPGMVFEPPYPGPKRKPCFQIYAGLVVRSNGDVQVCGCESAVNADEALVVGHILESSLAEIWQGERLQALRQSFGTPSLNSNCQACDMYYAPVDFHSPKARERASVSRRRQAGEIVRRRGAMTEEWLLD